MASKLSRLDNIQHMATNTFFSGQLPPALYERIEQHVAETGESKTQVIVNALSNYLNHPVIQITPVASDTINILAERFNALEDRITAVELSLNEVRGQNIKHPSVTGIEDIDNTTPDVLPEIEPVHQDNNSSTSITTQEVINQNTSDQSNIDLLQQEEKEDLPAFENLTSSEMAKATGLKQPQLDGHKRKLVMKYQKMGKNLQAKTILPAPEKIEVEPTIINDYPYNLYYLGQNDKGNNLWTALPVERKIYQ